MHLLSRCAYYPDSTVLLQLYDIHLPESTGDGKVRHRVPTAGKVELWTWAPTLGTDLTPLGQLYALYPTQPAGAVKPPSTCTGLK